MVDIAVILGADVGFAKKEMKEALGFEIELGKVSFWKLLILIVTVLCFSVTSSSRGKPKYICLL